MFLDAVLDWGEIDASAMGVSEAVRAAIDRSLSGVAMNVKAWKSDDKSLAPHVRQGRRPPGEPPLNSAERRLMCRNDWR